MSNHDCVETATRTEKQRRLRELKAAPEGTEIDAIGPIERTSRTLQAGELASIPTDEEER